MLIDDEMMQRALVLAVCAESEGEVPVGAIVVRDGVIIGEGYNRPITLNDPTAHAEIVALRAAAKHVGNYRLTDCTLYVTLEPCLMCAGAMIHARLVRVVYGAMDPKAGAVVSIAKMLDHPEINHRVLHDGGVQAQVCGDMLRAFFRKRR